MIAPVAAIPPRASAAASFSDRARAVAYRGLLVVRRTAMSSHDAPMYGVESANIAERFRLGQEELQAVVKVSGGGLPR
jgi:hypothetical protein